MATMEAAICMGQGTDCNWAKVIYDAILVKNGGASERGACKHHDILPQTHAERPCQHFINLSKIHKETTMKTTCYI